MARRRRNGGKWWKWPFVAVVSVVWIAATVMFITPWQAGTSIEDLEDRSAADGDGDGAVMDEAVGEPDRVAASDRMGDNEGPAAVGGVDEVLSLTPGPTIGWVPSADEVLTAEVDRPRPDIVTPVTTSPLTSPATTAPPRTPAAASPPTTPADAPPATSRTTTVAPTPPDTTAPAASPATTAATTSVPPPPPPVTEPPPLLPAPTTTGPTPTDAVADRAAGDDTTKDKGDGKDKDGGKTKDDGKAKGKRDRKPKDESKRKPKDESKRKPKDDGKHKDGGKDTGDTGDTTDH